MTRLITPWLALCLAGATAAHAGDQTCEGPMRRAVDDFVPLAAGAQLLDKQTRLVWARCVEDATWTGATCQANDRQAVNPGPRVTYAQAVKLAQSASSATQKWRLPTWAELDAIREPRCYNPSANLALFPTSPAWSSDGAYWTQSPQAGGRRVVDAIGTSDGWAKTDARNLNHVRLVRAATPDELKQAGLPAH